MREKLIELLKDTRANAAWHNWSYEESADHLIDNGVTIQKWIPVSERMPKRGQEVIVASYRTIKPVVFTMYFWDKEHDNWVGITHWMPLPKAPKGE